MRGVEPRKKGEPTRLQVIPAFREKVNGPRSAQRVRRQFRARPVGLGLSSTCMQRPPYTATLFQGVQEGWRSAQLCAKKGGQLCL